MEINLRFRIFKEPVSAATHFAAFWAAVAGCGVLLFATAHHPGKAAGMLIYGASLAALFLASSVYHFLDLGPRANRFLQRVDHAAIFFLIGGTYVPTVLHLLDGGTRLTVLGVVAAIACAGALFKLFWFDCPNWVGVGLYLAFGWLAIIPGWLMLPQLGALRLFLILGGGLAYTLGSLVYYFERPDPWPKIFGHHEIWHLFVIAGAALHYGFVLTLVDTPLPPF